MTTEYAAFMIGGSLIGAVLFLLARPVLETLDEFLVEHFETLRGRRRARLLGNFVSFLLAYKAVLTKYPPLLLPDLEADIAIQLQAFQNALRDVRQGRMLRSTVPYEVVRGTALTLQDFANWEIYDCRDWMEHLTAALSASNIPELHDAIRSFQAQPETAAWRTTLQVAEQALDCHAIAAIEHWHCLKRAHEDPAIRERLCTLLRLESVHRQGGIVTYLTSAQLRCSQEEIDEVMKVMRYEAVADRLLALLA